MINPKFNACLAGKRVEHDRGPPAQNIKHVLMPINKNTNNWSKPWRWARVLLQVANEQIQYAASIQEVGPSLDRAWHWMDCTKCWKLVPQEWDLTKTHKKALDAFWSRTGQRLDKRWRKGKRISFKTLPKTMVKWHKIIHPPATPKSYKGNTLALRQGRYYVGNHKVHIALQNKAWFGHVAIHSCSYSPLQTWTNTNISYLSIQIQAWWKKLCLHIIM